MSRVLCVAALFLVSCPSPGGDSPAFDDDDDDVGVDDDDVGLDDDDASDDDDAAADDDDTAASSSCADPWVSGPRLIEEGAERGLTERTFSALLDLGVPPDSDAGGSELAAHDLDGDGDVDLLLLRLDDGPTLYENDGKGYFTHRGEPLDFSFVVQPDWLPQMAQGVRVASVSAVDLSGDGLPELVTSGFGRVEIWPNQGGLSWGDPVPLHSDPTPGGVYTTTVFGDIDGDGQLDALLPTQRLANDSVPNASHPVLLRRADGSFVHTLDLGVGPEGSDSIASAISDFDRDGDADVMLLMDQGDRSGVFRNDGNGPDGLPVLTDVATDIGFDRPWNAMGMDSADLNGDGILDWCVSDNGPPACLYSVGDGYVESGQAVGLVPDEPVGALGTLGWSIDFADIDNDGWVEMIQPAGKAHDETDAFPDLLFHGLPGGLFEDLSAEWGFHSDEDHYAMATADFNGDGFLDIVTTGPGLPPRLYMARCGDEAWIDIDLAGPPGNAEAIGAHVEVELGDRILVRELYAQRAQGQTPSRLHFGLGLDAELVGVRVIWPGGERRELGLLRPNRRYQVRHPDSVAVTPPDVEVISLL